MCVKLDNIFIYMIIRMGSVFNTNLSGPPPPGDGIEPNFTKKKDPPLSGGRNPRQRDSRARNSREDERKRERMRGQER